VGVATPASALVSLLQVQATPFAVSSRVTARVRLPQGVSGRCLRSAKHGEHPFDLPAASLRSGVFGATARSAAAVLGRWRAPQDVESMAAIDDQDKAVPGSRGGEAAGYPGTMNPAQAVSTRSVASSKNGP
jgi:hypothetical protein